MVEKTPEAKLPISTREYIAYKSAVQDFALACRYSLNVLYGNSLQAEVSRPFNKVATENIETQLLHSELDTAPTDDFFGLIGTFHSSLGNHDTARVWAQHIRWPLKRFDALITIAEEERRLGIDTQETVQPAKYSLEVPIVANWLKPELAARWARLALYATGIQKTPAICLDIAKLILNSISPDFIIQEEKLELNSLYASVTRAYFIIAQVEGALGFDFESSLKSAHDSVHKVSDLKRAFELSLLALVVKSKLGAPVGNDIKQAKKMALGSWETPFLPGVTINGLLNLAQAEFIIKQNPEDTIQLARKLSSEQKDSLQSFSELIQIARFEKANGLDPSKTLFLARQAKQHFDSTKWDELERLISEVEPMKNIDRDFSDWGYITIGQAQEKLNRSKEAYHRWRALCDLIKAQIREGVPPSKAFEEAEALSSSFQNDLQVRSLLRLAELAAEAGINPIIYTDEARHIVYQRMIKSYRTGDIFQEITETEMNVARILMGRCHAVLAQIGQVEAEALTREAIRLNDKDCIRALGAFLPLDVQDKFASKETKNLLLVGRAMRGIW